MSEDTDGNEGEDRGDDSNAVGTAGDDVDAADGSGVSDDTRDGAEDGPLPGEFSVDTDAALEELDRRFVDLLSWLLDTETRARIYVYLRQDPNATSDEVADGTGLYPSTVRECLAEMAEDGLLERQKRQHAGAGNNPYEYAAIAPSDLVGEAVGDLQSELNSVFNLDCLLGCADRTPADDAVTISVEDGDPDDEA